MKEVIDQTMQWLGEQPDVVFVGYNTGVGFPKVAKDRLIETPLAENLMAGMAVGMALRGKIPVVYFERADFLTNALDAIVNHLDKLDILSDGLHRPACILRVVVGNRRKPLFTGDTHTQDFSEALDHMVAFPVQQIVLPGTVREWYEHALHRARGGVSTAIFEYKDLY